VKIHKAQEMRKKERIAVVVSVLWIIVATIIALSDSYRERELNPLVYEFRMDLFLQELLLFGTIPLVIGWGIWWITKR
jgi:hypothetical protein